MEKYDYRACIKADIEDFLKERKVTGPIDDDFRQTLEDEMFVDDSVTGNASGSYTCNTFTAEENICHNRELMLEAAEAFSIEDEKWKKGAEYWDVTIRCYLLNQVFFEVVEEWNKKYGEAKAKS